ncbi:hypothetical protein SPURM210S_03702 [Streptomyces purpurascens]
MPSTTQARARYRAAYGRWWQYSADMAPAIGYIARSSLPSTSMDRAGRAVAASTLSAGLNQMSEGRAHRSIPAWATRRRAALVLIDSLREMRRDP